MKSNRGFTLIEIIITIVITAIAATLFVTFLGRSFTQSAVSSGMVQSQYALIQQMEIITSSYRQALPIADLCTFKTANVDGQPFVDDANTSCTYQLTNGNYTTQNVVLVTLTDGQQTVLSIFTN